MPHPGRRLHVVELGRGFYPFLLMMEKGVQNTNMEWHPIVVRSRPGPSVQEASVR
jgi:hypothetical protein